MRKPALLVFACPRCGAECDDATVMSSGQPKPLEDDVGVCLHCAAPMRYRAGAPPVLLTFQDVCDLDDDVRSLLLKTTLGILTMTKREKL